MLQGIEQFLLTVDFGDQREGTRNQGTGNKDPKPENRDIKTGGDATRKRDTCEECGTSQDRLIRHTVEMVQSLERKQADLATASGSCKPKRSR